MAIAPSKLGQLVASVVGDRLDQAQNRGALYQQLLEHELLLASATLEDVATAMIAVQLEPNYRDPFNSPNERLRERLRPFLSETGQAWAEPLSSLSLPRKPEAPPIRRGRRRFRRRR